MKKIKLISALTLAALAFSSCAAPSGPNAQRGALLGGVTGAVLGGVVGNQSGRGLEGAALGAGAGASAGALIGNAQDQQQRRSNYYGY